LIIFVLEEENTLFGIDDEQSSRLPEHRTHRPVLVCPTVRASSVPNSANG
jgi:hypothetical protein